MKLIISILIIVFSFFILSCSPSGKKQPKAVHGVLDLRDWNFEKDGIVQLDGEWEFYWMEFLNSKDFDSVQVKHFIQVPKPWNHYKWGNKELGFEGYASYRLKILVNDKTKDLGLKFPDQASSFELYLNDSLIGKNGKIGKSRNEYEPNFKPLLIPFENKTDTVTLVGKIANFDYHYGGFQFAVFLGLEEQVRVVKVKQYTIDNIFAVAHFLLLIIFLLFFILRPKDYISLFLSVCSLLCVLRTIIVNERIINEIFPLINWEWIIKLDAFSWMVWVLFYIIVIKLFFKKEFSKIIQIILMIIWGSFVLITLITPAIFNTQLIHYAEIIAFASSIYCLYVIILAIFRKREGAIIILIGFIPTLLSAYNEILYYTGMIDKIYISAPFGLLIFNFSQMFILARMFSRAYNRIENFANELKIEVEEKTKDLRKEKEKSDSLLLNVLPEQIANRLKAGEAPIADHFEEASVIFIDIADFTKLSSRSKPQEIVKMLNDIFTIFDKISTKHGLEKIKTIGDCYMAAAGIPVQRSDHAIAVAMMALEVMETMKGYRVSDFGCLESKVENQEMVQEENSTTSVPCPPFSVTQQIQFRIGLDCGPIVAGVIGEQKFIYDLWGDMVNTASRMESNGVVGRIQCTERFKDVLHLTNVKQLIKFEERGEIEIKGKGKMKTYFIS